jgi:hypothetical protein
MLVMWSAVSVVTSEWIFWVGILAAHFILIVLAIRSSRRLNDAFIPVNILIGLAIVRFSLPATYFLFAQSESKLFEVHCAGHNDRWFSHRDYPQWNREVFLPRSGGDSGVCGNRSEVAPEQRNILDLGSSFRPIGCSPIHNPWR